MKRFDIRPAQPKDVKDLLDIQHSCSLKNRLKYIGSIEELSRAGFLVHLLDEAEILDLLKLEKRDVIFSAYLEDDWVVGYSLGYRLSLWKELNPDWQKTVQLEDSTDSKILSDNETFYYRHVATLLAVEPLAGFKLSKQLMNEVRSLGYKNIVGEILSEPYYNLSSYEIHRRLGCIEIGEVNEILDDAPYNWKLLRKDLTTSLP